MRNNMKKQIFILLAIMVIATGSYAQVTLQSFQIGQNYLQGTSLKVPNINAPTPFKFLVSVLRGANSNGGFVSGNCIIKLYYTENQSSDSNIPDDPSSLLLATKNITSSDYSSNQATLADLDASLPANKQYGKLILRFEYLDNQNINRISYSSTRYGIYIVPPVVTPPTIDATTIAKIQSMGFSTSGISSEGEYYTVENDILIRKSTLFQNAGEFLINNDRQHNVYILVKTSVWTMNVWDVITAAHLWNSNPNSDIKLHVLNEFGNQPLPPIDITIDYKPSSYPVRAEFPNGNGHAGSMIYVGLNQNQVSNINPIVAITRAIAHSLGLKNNSIPNSIMNSGGASNYVFPINTSDNQLMSSLYPVNPNSAIIPYISGVNSLNMHESGTFEMSYILLGTSYNWNIVPTNGTGNLGVPDISWASQLRLPEISFSAIGSYQIQCSLTTSKYTSSATAIVNVAVQ